MSTHGPDKSDSNNGARIPQCGKGFVGANLKAYLDGELSLVRKWIVSVHVSRCRACREEVAWLQRLGKNMRQLEGAYPRPELRARILSTLPPMDAAPILPSSVLRPRHAYYSARFAFAGAFCLLILAGAFAIGRVRSAASIKGGFVAAPMHPEAPGIKKHDAPVLPQNSPEAPQTPTFVEAPDPISAEANRMTAMQTQRDKEAAARRLPMQWKTVIAAVRSARTDTQTHEQPYVLVALDVKNVAAAETRLEAWARASKATARIVPRIEKDGQPPTASIVLTVAPGSNGSLFADLKKTGDVTAVNGRSAVGPATAMINAAIPLKGTSVSGTGDSYGNRHAITPTSIPERNANGTARTSSAKAPAAVTIMVVVQLVKSTQ